MNSIKSLRLISSISKEHFTLIKMIHRQHAFCRICKPINDFEGICIHVFHFYVKPNKYSIDFDQEGMAIEKQVIYSRPGAAISLDYWTKI